MRTSQQPKAELNAASTTLALYLEAFSQQHSIRQAGQLLLAEARRLAGQLSDQTAAALSAAERRRQVELGDRVRAAGRNLAGLYPARSAPGWLARQPSQSFAEFLAGFEAGITNLSAEIRAVAGRAGIGLDFQSTLAEWRALESRRQARETELPKIARAMALTRALRALAELAKLGEMA